MQFIILYSFLFFSSSSNKLIERQFNVIKFFRAIFVFSYLHRGHNIRITIVDRRHIFILHLSSLSSRLWVHFLSYVGLPRFTGSSCTRNRGEISRSRSMHRILNSRVHGPGKQITQSLGFIFSLLLKYRRYCVSRTSKLMRGYFATMSMDARR